MPQPSCGPFVTVGAKEPRALPIPLPIPAPTGPPTNPPTSPPKTEPTEEARFAVLTDVDLLLLWFILPLTFTLMECVLNTDSLILLELDIE